MRDSRDSGDIFLREALNVFGIVLRTSGGLKLPRRWADECVRSYMDSGDPEVGFFPDPH